MPWQSRNDWFRPGRAVLQQRRSTEARPGPVERGRRAEQQAKGRTRQPMSELGTKERVSFRCIDIEPDGRGFQIKTGMACRPVDAVLRRGSRAGFLSGGDLSPRRSGPEVELSGLVARGNRIS